MSLGLLYEPDEDPVTGKLLLKVGVMKNFLGPMFIKRTHVYVKAYLLVASSPIKVCFFFITHCEINPKQQQQQQQLQDSKRSTEMHGRAEEIEFNEELSWEVEAQTVLKHEVLVGIWGHSKLGKKNIPLGEVLITLQSARAEQQHQIKDPEVWLTFKK